MKILVIGTIDTKGGAAQISWELRKRLKAEGHTVSTFVRYKYSSEPDVFVIPRRRWQDWLVKIFADDLRFARTGYIFDTPEYKSADIIHCHNLKSNFFNLRSLERMSREKPVVWTIHDLWPITGFASDSVTLRKPNKKKFFLFLWDRTPALLRAKNNIYKKCHLTVVAVSEWLKGELSQSILAMQNIVRIYNGVDTNIFKPSDRASARRDLGLPLDKKIVGFGIKGWTSSREAMEHFKNRDDVFFVAVGNSNVSDSKNLKSFGFIEDKNTLAKILSAIDIFFYPTEGDTFGLSVAEAQACGIPAVTFNVDALPEIVVHKETGYVAASGDLTDAISGIEYLLSMPQNERGAMGSRGRERVRDIFDVERMYAEYRSLYSKIVLEFTKKS